MRRGGAGSLGDELERQRRIDGGGLAGFEIGEALDIMVKALADFVYPRLHQAHQRRFCGSRQ